MEHIFSTSTSEQHRLFLEYLFLILLTFVDVNLQIFAVRDEKYVNYVAIGMAFRFLWYNFDVVDVIDFF